MKLKFTKTNLDKLLRFLEEQGYKVRFEKGNFKSGYCIVKDQKIAIVNKFFDVKARIECLLDILSKINVNPDLFTEKSQELIKQIGFDLLIKPKLVA